jgi:hypothetical protein
VPRLDTVFPLPTLRGMCDTLVALGPATVDGITRFAKNSDRPPHELQALEWSPARVDTGLLRCTHVEIAGWGRPTVPALISRPTWGWGAEHGVNVAGVAIGNEAIYTRLDPRTAPPALTGMDLVRLGLERSDTARGAVAVILDLLERYGQGGSGHDHRTKPYWSSFLVADPHDAWVVETSGQAWATEQVARTRAISNRTTIPAFDAEHRHTDQPVARTVDPRWHRSQRLLARGAVATADLQAHLANHEDGPWSVCMHVGTDDGQPEVTTASIVVELPDGAPPVAWCASGSPCSTPYERIEVVPPAT